jgi:peptidoglycan/xylan/chitin deacetylase (PgdA/CDA1 family)
VTGSLSSCAVDRANSSAPAVTGRTPAPTSNFTHTPPPSKPLVPKVPTTGSGKKSQPGNPLAAAAGRRKVLFFSFDDGPDPVWTEKVLRVLAKYDAKATFFQLGEMIRAYPSLKEQVLAAGHTIGNHSISHPQLTAISAARRHHEIFDGPKSKCFRPPYGATNKKVRADIRAAGMTQVLWTVDPTDWGRPGTSAIANNILSNAGPGGVILLHDGGGDRSQTVAALERVLPILKARGYSFAAMDC